MEDDVLRKLGATLLALPVLALFYLALIGRRGVARAGAVVAAAAVVALVVLASLPPAPSNAVPVSSLPQPVDARLLDAVATGHGLKQPFTVEFDAAMDAASVAAALRIQPDTAVSFAWDDAGRVLTVAPLRGWRPDTLYTLTVARSARSADGGAMAKDLRSVVLTARAGSATVEATRASGDRVRIDSAFRITVEPINETTAYFCNSSEMMTGSLCRFLENLWSSLYNCIVACCAFAKHTTQSSGTTSSFVPRRMVMDAGIFCSNNRGSIISSSIL